MQYSEDTRIAELMAQNKSNAEIYEIIKAEKKTRVEAIKEEVKKIDDSLIKAEEIKKELVSEMVQLDIKMKINSDGKEEDRKIMNQFIHDLYSLNEKRYKQSMRWQSEGKGALVEMMDLVEDLIIKTINRFEAGVELIDFRKASEVKADLSKIDVEQSVESLEGIIDEWIDENLDGFDPENNADDLMVKDILKQAFDRINKTYKFDRS